MPPVGLASADLSIVGALAALWSIQASAHREATLLISLLLAAPCGWAVTEGDRWVRRHNDKFGDWILGHLKEGRERVLWKALALWAGLWFAKSWVAFVALGFLGQEIVNGLLNHLPVRVLYGLDAGARFLPAACFAAALSYFWGRLRPRRAEAP